MLKIAIASGKGGTGKTFLSTNLFHLLQRAGERVVLVDCDAEVPDDALFLKMEAAEERSTAILCPEIDPEACLYCGKCADWCSYHAITCLPSLRYIRLLPDLCHGCGACVEACASGAVRPAEREIGKVTAYRRSGQEQPVFFEARMQEGVHSPVPVIRDAIAWGRSSGAEVMLFDAPPGCACPFVNTVIGADKVVLVTEPTPFGLSDLRHTVQVLRELGKDFGVVLNRADLGDGQMKAYLQSEQIPLLGEIPYSETIASIYARGELAVEADPAYEALFRGLWERIEACGTYEDSGHQR